MEDKKVLEKIIKLYNRNHCNKWRDLTKEEQEEYFNRNLWRLKKIK